MNYTNKNDYWYDKNNNRWTTEEDAERYSPTLIDCYDCNNCIGCTNCKDCTDCKDCYDCTYCVKCHNCIYCKGCYKCLRSISCEHCEHSYDCENHYCNEPKNNKLIIDLSGEIIEIKGVKYKLVKV